MSEVKVKGQRVNCRGDTKRPLFSSGSQGLQAERRGPSFAREKHEDSTTLGADTDFREGKTTTLRRKTVLP